MPRHVAACLTALLILTGCGGSAPLSPAAPDPPAVATQPSLRIVADPVVTMTRGSATTLQTEERDASGNLVTGQTGYTWRSSAPGVVTVDGTGRVTSRGTLGGASITATSASGLQGQVHIWVQPPAGAPSAFRMSVRYQPDVPALWRASFNEAAAIWESVIRDALPPFSLDGHPQTCEGTTGDPIRRQSGIERGVRVQVFAEPFHEGPGSAAAGGPCFRRPGPQLTTALGHVWINSHMDPEAIHESLRRSIALHELGHTLGLVGLFRPPAPAWYDDQRRIYRGIYALEGFRLEYGRPVSELELHNSHWRAPIRDVMGSPGNPLSRVSIGALMDLGYPARW